MKEIPILFSTHMVQAILEGRKTMTRRIIKPQPINGLQKGIGDPGWYDTDFKCTFHTGEYIKCPYGHPGDVLWVREKFACTLGEYEPEITYSYFADNFHWSFFPEDRKPDIQWHDPDLTKEVKWKPSIHMPKDYVRIWLQVEEIRVERLQDISWEDAIAEGIHVKHWGGDTAQPYAYRKSKPIGLATDYKRSPIEAFQDLWIEIAGEESWKANPWVWVVKYQVLSTTGKPSL